MSTTRQSLDFKWQAIRTEVRGEILMEGYTSPAMAYHHGVNLSDWTDIGKS